MNATVNNLHSHRATMRIVSALALLGLLTSAFGEDPNNPVPCVEWNCVSFANVTKVVVDGPKVLKLNESGTWTATATTTTGKQVCVATGAERDCPVTEVKWAISAGDQSSATNTITRSWGVAGTYTVSATGTPISDCCPGSGTSGSMTVVVECKASTTVDKITYTGDEFGKLFKRIAEVLEALPCVSKAKAEVTAGGSLEIGEECCPGASSPTPYKKGKINCTANLGLEFMPPPPIAYYSVEWIPIGTPGYFGDPWILATIKETLVLGPYGAITLDAGLLSDEIKWGECGNCIKITTGPVLKGKVGVKGEATIDVFLGEVIESKPDYSLSVSIDANGNATWKTEAWIKVGSAADCTGWDAGGCFDGLKLEFKAQLKLKGLGSISVSKEFGPWLKKCK